MSSFRKAVSFLTYQMGKAMFVVLCLSMTMEMGNIELMVKLQVSTYIHDQRVVHRQFTPDTR